MFVSFCLVALGGLQAADAAELNQEAPGQPTEPAFVEPLTEPMAVIPPGREDLLAEMLGRGETLPGQCSFGSGEAKNDTVTASYACSTGTVVLTLRHPSKASPDATLTEQFAIAVQTGSPPAGLVEAVAARIRSREKAFEWTWLKPTVGQRSRRSVAVLLAVFAVLMAGGALWLALRRPRRKES